eukprot:scaffold395_cov383-Prasinococcus_capsulatus_cf.AAC.6
MGGATSSRGGGGGAQRRPAWCAAKERGLGSMSATSAATPGCALLVRTQLHSPECTPRPVPTVVPTLGRRLRVSNGRRESACRGFLHGRFPRAIDRRSVCIRRERSMVTSATLEAAPGSSMSLEERKAAFETIVGIETHVQVRHKCLRG